MLSSALGKLYQGKIIHKMYRWYERSSGLPSVTDGSPCRSSVKAL
jgi:hypothetical protein